MATTTDLINSPWVQDTAEESVRAAAYFYSRPTHYGTVPVDADDIPGKEETLSHQQVHGLPTRDMVYMPPDDVLKQPVDLSALPQPELPPGIGHDVVGTRTRRSCQPIYNDGRLAADIQVSDSMISARVQTQAYRGFLIGSDTVEDARKAVGEC